MKLNIVQLICLINYVFTFPDELFDELWQTNQSEPQTNNNSIKSQPKIKVEPNEEQFDGRWQDESALKGIVKVEHEPHYGAVKVEEQLEDHVKEEDQHGQALNHDERVDEQQNESNKSEKIESDQQKSEIIKKFREIKNNYQNKNKRAHSTKEWNQIEAKISNGLGINRTKLYKWRKELGLIQEKFSELEKHEIVKQFEKIKSKCKKAKLKNISKNELDEKISKKLGICRKTIYDWKGKFGLSVSNKFSDATKIGILKKYAKIKEENPKMTNAVIADMLKISTQSLNNWKKQFNEINNI